MAGKLPSKYVDGWLFTSSTERTRERDGEIEGKNGKDCGKYVRYTQAVLVQIKLVI